jgi:hypothetical protein
VIRLNFLFFSLPTLIVGILTISASATAWAADDNVDSQKATESVEQLRAWVEDLGSDDYSRRQYADLQLARNQLAALPIVLESLKTSIGEKAERLLLFLARLASDPYSVSGVKSMEAMEKLAQQDTTSRSLRARRILNEIYDDQKLRTLEQMRAVGAEPRNASFQIISSETHIKNALVLDSHYRGDEVLLERLRWLDQVEFVRLEGTAASVSTLKYIFKLPNLNRLQLVNANLTQDDLSVFDLAPDLTHVEFIYAKFGDESVPAISRIPVWDRLYLFGTKLTQSGKRDLIEKMEGVDVIVAKGGFLGVRCYETSVEVNEVVPGGAADLASLQRQDRILRVNGIQVSVFEDLRKELANFAEGESVDIEFSRRGSIKRTTAVLQLRPDLQRMR